MLYEEIYDNGEWVPFVGQLGLDYVGRVFRQPPRPGLKQVAVRMLPTVMPVDDGPNWIQWEPAPEIYIAE